MQSLLCRLLLWTVVLFAAASSFSQNVALTCGACADNHQAIAGNSAIGKPEASRVAMGGVPPSWTTGPKRLLFMRLVFPDAPAEPMTVAEATDLMTQVNDWYVEKSYGALSITTDVTPLLMMPQPRNSYLFGPLRTLLEHARAAAATNGYSTNDYDLDIARFAPIQGLNFSGSAVTRGKGLWLQVSHPGVVIHELGHNLGLEHANFWTSGADSIIGPGTNVEYGNIFDTMGQPPSNPDDYHFNVCWLDRLGWLANSSVATVNTSGLYRLHAFDVATLTPGAIYGLRIRKDQTREYWAEFRQKFFGNPWTQNGILLNWSPWRNSRFGTHLLDTTPASPAGNDGKDDAALVVGRTLSDALAGVHVTPLSVSSNGAGRSIDVQVHLGAFSNNVAPTLLLAADRLNVDPGEPVAFIASANDVNGDSLAYHWDFGDLSISSNSATTVKAWQQPGEYSVRCTVSDMKGGVASRNVVVVVGSPAVFRVSGRITDGQGGPIEGVRVHNGGVGSLYRGVYTDSDGHYTLVNLPAGSHTLAAVKYGYNLLSAGWANPVSVGPNAADRHWTASPYPPVSVLAVDASATESQAGSDTATFTIARSGSLSAPVTIRFNLEGTAELFDDYTLSAGGSTWPYTVVLPAGVATTNIVLTPGDESEREGTEVVTLTLLEDVGYTISTNSATATIADSIGGILPTILWDNPADIVYGTALGSQQLDAFTFDQGTLTYDPPAGTVLDAGTARPLAVVFTPADPLRYESATNYVAVNVLKKPLTVTADDLTTVHGAPFLLTASYDGFVNGDTPADLDVPASITTEATPSSLVGSYPITVSGASDANYSMSFVPGVLTLTRATTTGELTSSPNPALLGQTVTFTFSVSAVAPSTAVPVGTVRFSVDGSSASVPLVNGVATYSTAELSLGSHSVMADYAGAANFLSTIRTLDPDQFINSPPMISWPGPAPIVYGAALGVAELNASATMPGTFVYDPPAGAMLNAGSNQVLSVTFTPSNSIYPSITTNVLIDILRRPLTVTAASTNKIYGAPLPVFTASYIGFVNNDSPASLDTPVTFATLATSSTDVGSYSIDPTGGNDLNYAMTFVSGTLTITRAGTVGTVNSSANPALSGQQVTFTFTANPVAPSTATPAGEVLVKVDGIPHGAPLVNGVATFNTSTLTIGSHAIEVEYGGNANWIGTTNRLSPDQLVNNLSSPRLAIAPLGNGAYRISFEGNSGATYRIDFSTSNLSNWQALGSVTTNGVGAFEIIDTPPPSSSQRFYRAVYP